MTCYVPLKNKSLKISEVATGKPVRRISRDRQLSEVSAGAEAELIVEQVDGGTYRRSACSAWAPVRSRRRVRGVVPAWRRIPRRCHRPTITPSVRVACSTKLPLSRGGGVAAATEPTSRPPRPVGGAHAELFWAAVSHSAARDQRRMGIKALPLCVEPS